MDDNQNNQKTNDPDLIPTPQLDQNETNNPAKNSVVEEPQPSTNDQNATSETQTYSDQKESSQAVSPTAVVSSHKESKKSKLILISVVVLLLLAVGFLGFKAFNTKDNPTKTASVATVKKDVPVLNVSVNPTPINSFYPSEDQAQLPNYLINGQLYEGLVQYYDISKIKPLLATSWTNPNDQTWVFTLKQGVKFHDGNTMSAKDVKYSLEQYPQKSFQGVFTISLKSIDVIDPSHVRIVTDGPDPLLLHKLAYLYIVDSAKADSNVLVGTGPYEIKKGTTPTETAADLTAFNGYHGGHVYTKELKFNATEDDATQIDYILNKNTDFGIGFSSKSGVAKFNDNKTFKLEMQQGLGSSYIGINHLDKTSPLANIKVRQAISYALDRQKIIDSADLSGTSSSQLVPQQIPGYNPNIKSVTQDTAKAKQLLSEAGYNNGLTFTLSYVQDQADKQAKEIANQLKVIGITVRLNPLKDFVAYNDSWSSGKMQAFIEGYTSDLFDSSDVYAYMVKDNPYYTNQQVSNLLDKAGSTLDQNKRLTYLLQSSKILNDDLNVIPTYIVDTATVAKNSYAVQPGMFAGPYFWQVYQK